MATAVLHIGTMKTGTTYLQQLLSTNSQLLAEQGWTLPDFLPANHQAFPLCFSDKTSDQHRTRGMYDSASKNKAALDLRVALKKQMNSSATPPSQQKWIISSEQFTMRLRSQAEIAKAVTFFREVFDSVSVVVFFRRAEFMLPSVLSQRIKDGLKGSWSWQFCENRLERLDPIQIFDAWSAAVGEENITAVPYLERYKSDSTDFLGATSRATGITFDSQWIEPALLESNRSLSAEGMGFISLTNQYVPRRALDDRRAAIVNRRLKKKIMSVADPAPFVPDQETLDRVTEYCSESCNELVGRFPEDPLWQAWLDQVPKGAAKATPTTLTAERTLELAVQVASPNGPVSWGELYGVPPSRKERMHRYWDIAKTKASRKA